MAAGEFLRPSPPFTKNKKFQLDEISDVEQLVAIYKPKTHQNALFETGDAIDLRTYDASVTTGDSRRNVISILDINCGYILLLLWFIAFLSTFFWLRLPILHMKQYLLISSMPLAVILMIIILTVTLIIDRRVIISSSIRGLRKRWWRVVISFLYCTCMPRYGHLMIILVISLFFVVISLMNFVVNLSISKLLLISYISVYYFLALCTAGGLWYMGKCVMFLIRCILIAIAFITNVIVYVYWCQPERLNNFDDKLFNLYVVRSCCILHWLLTLANIQISYQHIFAVHVTKKMIVTICAEACACAVSIIFIWLYHRNILTLILLILTSVGVVQLLILIIIDCDCDSKAQKIWIPVYVVILCLIVAQSVSLFLFMDVSLLWIRVDIFGGIAILWMMLLVTLRSSMIQVDIDELQKCCKICTKKPGDTKTYRMLLGNDSPRGFSEKLLELDSTDEFEL
eukprot:259474_1